MSDHPGPAFAVSQIPFSHAGSWLNLSPVIAENVCADDVHLVSHQTGLHAVLALAPLSDDTVVTATPAALSWTGPGGRIDAAFDGVDTLRLRGSGLGMRISAAAARLTPFSGHYWFRDPRDGAFVFTVYETGRRYRITVLDGAPSDVSGLEALGDAARGMDLPAGRWELAVEEYETARPTYRATRPFEQVVSAAAARFRSFCASVAPWRDESTPAAELACYVLWSAIVRPRGFVTRQAVLMSKHWMDKVWSWDHCFTAIALAGGDTDLAVDQYLLPFDHSDGSGALPDSITHSEVLHNFVKPPVHGWAWDRLRAAAARQPAIAAMRESYERLSAWTSFWLQYRRVPGRALAHYQHGNDSGWDNATVFDRHRVVESADLAAFLVLQQRALAGLATELGEHDRARSWTESADRMQRAMLAELWTGSAFVTQSPHTGETWHAASLLLLMPIVLGDALPRHVRETLLDGIRTHLTEWGLATERPDSPKYEADGYWRGPIWAPSTVLVEDGVRRCGDIELADTISMRFRRLCETSGFAENFDAVTGAGLRDRAYTWTAAGYLILARAAVQGGDLSAPGVGLDGDTDAPTE